jgi:hypothetical protein
MIVTDVSSSSSTLEYVHTQGTPLDTWVIDHNMGCYPSVTVIDSSNNQVEGSVTYDTINRITIRFTSGFSGRAILR